jgi:hypothetical protein
MMKHHMTCCVCGGDAGFCKQHYNRDTGYGICPRCVAEEAATNTPEHLRSMYGTAGVHYDQPTVRHLGRRYKVMATTRSRDVANRFIAAHAGASVLKVFDDSTIVLVHEKDEGELLEHSSEAA